MRRDEIHGPLITIVALRHDANSFGVVGNGTLHQGHEREVHVRKYLVGVSDEELHCRG
jgi:hypothetical protein